MDTETTTFGQQERRRQQAFRDSSRTISTDGGVPTDAAGRRGGHLLALGHEDENLYPALREPPVARMFFAARGIRWWQSTRSGDDTRKNGPTRNLASSQLACMNFLLPLVDARGALVALLRQFDDDVREVVTLEYAPRNAGTTVSSPVELEWVGSKSNLEGGPGTRGANTTSADALMVGVTGRGVRRAYLIEWKYVEDYTGARDQGESRAGETRHRRYAALYRAPDSRFNGQVPMEELLYEPFYQFLRLSLLADKMVNEGEFGVTEAKVVVVCPTHNDAYRTTMTSPALQRRFPDARTVEAAFRSTLRDPASFAIVSPDTLLTAIRQSPVQATLTQWLAYQHERYGH